MKQCALDLLLCTVTVYKMRSERLVLEWNSTSVPFKNEAFVRFAALSLIMRIQVLGGMIL